MTTLGRLVPQCYESTILARPKLLPSPRVWWWAAAAIVGIWLAVASVLWSRVTAPIEANRITVDMSLDELTR